MDIILTPPILFFLLGLVATLLGSNLSIPKDIMKFMSIYLLIAIGYNGGFELHNNGIDRDGITIMLACGLFSFVMPVVFFKILRLYSNLNKNDAIIIATSFSSVSAVTFITALNVIISHKIKYDGYMVVGLTLMEFPAIISGLIIYNVLNNEDNIRHTIKNSIKNSLLDYSIVILVGSLIIGYLCGDTGHKEMYPLLSSLFKGFLSIFLLGMGIMAANQFDALRKVGIKLILFAIIMPFICAVIAIILCKYIGTSEGNALLLAVLFGSASYIAVPAAFSGNIKDINVGLMTSVALLVTFLFNITIGINLYLNIIKIIF